ncbi:MAG: elongation factor P [Alphaproteobacteria bacterium]
MKIDGNEIRPGNVIEHQNRLWRAVKTQHVKPGKGGAFLQVELKDIRDGTKLNERFRSAETVERVRLDQETYDQVSLTAEMVGEDQVPYLQDGMVVMIESYEDEPISVTLPERVTLTVTEADAVVKGQTASSSYKPAILENGVKVLVPPHIEAGTAIVVATADGTYVERAKD